MKFSSLIFLICPDVPTPGAGCTTCSDQHDISQHINEWDFVLLNQSNNAGWYESTVLQASCMLELTYVILYE